MEIENIYGLTVDESLDELKSARELQIKLRQIFISSTAPIVQLIEMLEHMRDLKRIIATGN